MKRYLTAILRNQFNLFYRCGYTFVPKIHLIEFDGSITKEKQSELFKLFKKLTPFDYEEEFLIIDLEKELDGSLIDNVLVTVTDVLNVIPLSDRAKATIESRIDPRIRLEEPKFDYLLEQIEKRDQAHQLNYGIEAITSLCDISKERKAEILDHVGIQNLINGIDNRKEGIKPDALMEVNYWEYLITYERYEYFPNSTLGYFYDAGQIFVRSFKKQESFEGSGFHSFLSEQHDSKPDLNIIQILELLESEEIPKPFVEQNTINGVKYYLISVLFLRFKEEIRKTDTLESVSFIKNRSFFEDDLLKESFEYAVVLIGAFFGLSKFYDEYYDKLNLRFFKPQKERTSNKKLIGSKQDETKTKVDVERSLSREEQFTNIILDLFLKRTRIELKELVEIVKDKTGFKRVTQTELRAIINEMNGIAMEGRKTAYSIEKEPRLL